MSFGNLKVYPFPAVQYIPLPVPVIQNGPIVKRNLRTDQTQLVIGAAVPKWLETSAAEYGIKTAPKPETGVLPLIALNLEINDIKYRGYYVTMTGREKPGSYQYCAIPRRYFYKDNLFFELFDEKTGTRLIYASLNLKSQG